MSRDKRELINYLIRFYPLLRDSSLPQEQKDKILSDMYKIIESIDIIYVERLKRGV